MQIKLLFRCLFCFLLLFLSFIYSLPSNFLNHFEELCFAFTATTLFILLLEQSLITNSERKRLCLQQIYLLRSINALIPSHLSIYSHPLFVFSCFCFRSILCLFFQNAYTFYEFVDFYLSLW